VRNKLSGRLHAAYDELLLPLCSLPNHNRPSLTHSILPYFPPTHFVSLARVPSFLFFSTLQLSRHCHRKPIWRLLSFGRCRIQGTSCTYIRCALAVYLGVAETPHHQADVQYLLSKPKRILMKMTYRYNQDVSSVYGVYPPR